VGSAYAIRWFFEPLDVGDPIHYVLWWVVSAGFGLLGFYLSRSLTYRLMNKESIWAYAPVFALVEFFEILCNYSKAVAAVAMGQVPWVVHVPAVQQPVMVVLTYIGWSILPLVSPAMAVADMDMTRRRNGEVAEQRRPAGNVYAAGSARGTAAGSGAGSPRLAPLPPRQQPQPLAKGAQNGVNPSPGVQVNS